MFAYYHHAKCKMAFLTKKNLSLDDLNCLLRKDWVFAGVICKKRPKNDAKTNVS